MKIAITATTRNGQGTGASRRLRHANKVPGIIYGGGANTTATAIELDHNDIFHKLRHEEFHASILDMTLDGKAQQVLLRDVQMHAWKQIVLHVDFQRVAADQKIHMKVPLHYSGEEESQAVKLDHCLVNHVVTELDISCLPADLPEFIKVDLVGLKKGASLHISTMPLPAGVTAVPPSRGGDPVVATIIIPRAAVAEEVATPAVSAADVPAANQKAKEEEKKDDKGGKDKK